MADYEKFENPAAITDQEIRDEYEKNKNTRDLKCPDFDSGSKEPAAGSEQPPRPGWTMPNRRTATTKIRRTRRDPRGSSCGRSTAVRCRARKRRLATGRGEAESPAENPERQSRRAGSLHGVELALADANDDPLPAAPADEQKPASDGTASEAPADEQKPAATESQPATSATSEGDKPAEPAGEGAAVADGEAGAAAPAGDATASKYEPLEKVEVRRF